jgi:hypothetical protein
MLSWPILMIGMIFLLLRYPYLICKIFGDVLTWFSH